MYSADAERVRSISNRLDLVLATARLGSYFLMVGKLKEAEEQRQKAQQDFDQLLVDWAAQNIDSLADAPLHEKRSVVEQSLQVLAAGHSCSTPGESS